MTLGGHKNGDPQRRNVGMPLGILPKRRVQLRGVAWRRVFPPPYVP